MNAKGKLRLQDPVLLIVVRYVLAIALQGHGQELAALTLTLAWHRLQKMNKPYLHSSACYSCFEDLTGPNRVVRAEC